MNMIEMAKEFDRLAKDPVYRAKFDEFNKSRRDMIEKLSKDRKINKEENKEKVDIKTTATLAKEFDRLAKDPVYRAKFDEFNKSRRDMIEKLSKGQKKK